MRGRANATLSVALPSHLNNNDWSSYAFMAGLYQQLAGVTPDRVVLDASETVFFAASMCPALAAVLAKSGYLDRTSIANVREPVQRALARTGFMQRFGYKPVHDGYGSAVAYEEFDSADSRRFARYVEAEVTGRSQMPPIAESTQLVLEQSIHEIRENAESHSGSAQFLTGGQFYPRKHELCVTFADPGIGIPAKVARYLGSPLSGTDAILWALQADTTTRRREHMVPGGIGLHRIQEFLRANEGRLLIVSGEGFVLDARDRQYVRRLPLGFPGTVVMMEIDTSADTTLWIGEPADVMF